MVYVINYDGKPLMPCEHVIARLLLKEKKAKVVRREPFTIKLLYKPKTEYVQKCTLGIDPGSSKIGSAVVDENGDVLYMSQVEVRNDIARKMQRRAKYRRTRRSRKTRYRKPRFNNRKNSIKDGRLPPTVVSKIDSHLKEIKFVKSILPIANVVIETSTFDTHLMKDPSLKYRKHWGYQKGTLYGFANMKEFVLQRDGYKCQHCKGKSKDPKLHVHHIVFRSQGGSDNENNLITLCETCHKKLHNGEIELKLRGKRKDNLKHASQMNVIKSQLLKRVEGAIGTFGYITKENRINLGLPKEHYIDAVVIASGGSSVKFKQKNVLFKKCVAKGDYRRTFGRRSEKKIPSGKLYGFKHFDKVIYNDIKCFIKGRDSKGYANLMDIYGEKIDLRPMPKFSKMKRIAARKSWIIMEYPIHSFC